MRKNQDFISYYDPFLGNCFKFNADRTKKVSHSGSLHGLRLQLFSDRIDQTNSLLAQDSGFTIFITDQNATINTFYLSGVNAPVGFTTNIALKKYSIKNQPHPYSKCVLDLTQEDSYPSEMYKKTFKLNNRTYNELSCMNLCWQTGLVKKCGCFDPRNGPSPSVGDKPCLTRADQTCNNLYRLDLAPETFVTRCNCPLVCQKSIFETTVTLSNQLSPNGRFLNINRKQIAAVNIFFNEFSETLMIDLVKIKMLDVITGIFS
jgi:hypothetical protein